MFLGWLSGTFKPRTLFYQSLKLWPAWSKCSPKKSEYNHLIYKIDHIINPLSIYPEPSTETQRFLCSLRKVMARPESISGTIYQKLRVNKQLHVHTAGKPMLQSTGLCRNIIFSRCVYSKTPNVIMIMSLVRLLTLTVFYMTDVLKYSVITHEMWHFPNQHESFRFGLIYLCTGTRTSLRLAMTFRIKLVWSRVRSVSN